jgi:hypothetical protein
MGFVGFHPVPINIKYLLITNHEVSYNKQAAQPNPSIVFARWSTFSIAASGSTDELGENPNDGFSC